MRQIKDLGNTDVLIIGGGLAAMYAALEASRNNVDIVIVSKKTIGRSGASVVSKSVHRYAPDEASQKREYKRNIIESGRYLNNESLVDVWVEQSSRRVESLKALNPNISFKEVYINRKAYTNFASCNPKKGVHLTVPIAELLKKQSGISFLEGYMAVDLAIKGGYTYGALVEKDNKLYFINAKSVVIATGGASRIFSQTSGTNDLTGDGYAMARRAGLPLLDMEFIQFYPYRICHPNSHDIFPDIFKYGATFVNEKGERFMEKYPKQELENRDTLSRQMYLQKRVFLDMENVNVTYLKDECDDLYDIYLKYSEKRYEVKPVAHYTMGGIIINSDCSTDIKGLFCCGEVVGGLHGANRLAGHALTETAVFGHIAGTESANYAKTCMRQTEYPELNLLPSIGNHRIIGIREDLRTLMWENVGVVRTADLLFEAEEKIDTFLFEMGLINPYRLRDWIELMNMIDIAKSVVKSCICRKESRGSHYRDDFPQEECGWLGSVLSNEDKTVFVSKKNINDSPGSYR